MIKRIKLVLVLLLILIALSVIAEGSVRLISPELNRIPLSIMTRTFELLDHGPFRDMDWTPLYNWDNVVAFTSLYRDDMNIGFRMIPNRIQERKRVVLYGSKDQPLYTIRLNKQGFRDRNYKSPTGKKIFRIACLGDSNTFGYNVKNTSTYPVVLERLLQQEYSRAKFKVFNWGGLYRIQNDRRSVSNE